MIPTWACRRKLKLCQEIPCYLLYCIQCNCYSTELSVQLNPLTVLSVHCGILVMRLDYALLILNAQIQILAFYYNANGR